MNNIEEITIITKKEILNALEDVKDPEIPTISIVELGIVTDVIVNDENFVTVTLTPTFAGCPALNYMEELVKKRIEELDVNGVEVKTTFDVPWNTDKISERGREMLKKHGLAPPPYHNGLIQIEFLNNVKCPYCGSTKTDLKTPFGPTLCRSLHYCNNCKQAFEQFKPVA
jgi:ring-1,2-phenylacetyl-CoA epoxidase subunit PaaD